MHASLIALRSSPAVAAIWSETSSRFVGAASAAYHFNTGGTIGGGVVSYELGGKQYVATTSGVVSGFFGGSGPSAVVIFAPP